MGKISRIAGTASIAFLLIGCQTSEDETEALETEQVEDLTPDEHNNGDVQEDANDGTEETQENTNDLDAYAETEETPNYFIDTNSIDGEIDGVFDFYTAFSIRRDAEQDLLAEDRLEMSLIDNDPSEQELLSSFADLSVEGSILYVNFNVDDNQLAATSAQSSLFYNSLIGISDLYGIEEIIFLNPDGEEDIIVAERGVDKPIKVEDERGLSRGYYTIYDEGLEQTLFLSGGEIGEQLENEDGEPLSFPETVEVMQMVDDEGAFYSSAVVEGIEIVDASFEDGHAVVQYTMDEAIVTDSDRIVFENAIQLTALDFHAKEVRLINNTAQEIITYPLMG
ncbi:hypothetical protein [Alkalicoccobacillus porphyridii]|uniref:Uncharacterized protein n=1 Tax=Alkalicoccobacillus porphyridii TaxID=2597270 RepID=A0A554A271_9BACI|nr:hypothetical protein [Alkalicoccobacillus porphyridii]TSB47789.1 hypothetical protein FN960_04540 [Alkalicoccobacillus porphyridii]